MELGVVVFSFSLCFASSASFIFIFSISFPFTFSSPLSSSSTSELEGLSEVGGMAVTDELTSQFLTVFLTYLLHQGGP